MKTDLASSTESSEDSDDSGGMSQSHSPHRRRVNPETARTNGHIPTRTRKQVLVIRNKDKAEKSRPVTRSSTLQRGVEYLESAPGTSGRIPPSTKPTMAKRKTTVDRNPSVIRGRPIVTRSAIFKPTKFKTITTILPEEGKRTSKRRGRTPNSSSTMPKVSSDES